MLANHFVIVTDLAENLRQNREFGLVTFDLNTTEIFPMGEFYYRSGINTLLGANNSVIGVLKYVSLGQKIHYNISMYIVTGTNTPKNFLS